LLTVARLLAVTGLLLAITRLLLAIARLLAVTGLLLAITRLLLTVTGLWLLSVAGLLSVTALGRRRFLVLLFTRCDDERRTDDRNRENRKNLAHQDVLVAWGG
jgi:hypothetical protein